jgi:hypothetical protein
VRRNGRTTNSLHRGRGRQPHLSAFAVPIFLFGLMNVRLGSSKMLTDHGMTPWQKLTRQCADEVRTRIQRTPISLTFAGVLNMSLLTPSENGTAASDETAPQPMRRMRKGTRSCTECEYLTLPPHHVLVRGVHLVRAMRYSQGSSIPSNQNSLGLTIFLQSWKSLSKA